MFAPFFNCSNKETTMFDFVIYEKYSLLYLYYTAVGTLMCYLMKQRFCIQVSNNDYCP